MRHNRALAVTVFLVLAVMIWPLSAQQKSPSDAANKTATYTAKLSEGASDELDAIRQASRSFVDAFNKEDAKTLAALWTEDGDYIDESGQVFAGHEAIQKEYARFFEENDGVTIKVMVDSLRLLSDDAAIEDGRAMLDPTPAGAPAISRYTAVHVKVDGKWRMSTVRDVRIETPSGYHNVEDLEFLIGKWTAEENGAKSESVCRWVANKSFVQRDYTVTHADGITTSGIQLIGWNPEEGHMQSWNFSSDGGHAVGIWTPVEGGWVAEMRGTTGDGIPTTSINTLTRLDDNAYVWQSIQRSASGVALPDTDEVVIKRVPAE